MAYIRRLTVRLILGLALIPIFAHAGVVYEMTGRSLTDPPKLSSAAHYVVQGDAIRVATSDGRSVFIFKDDTIYGVDNTLRSVSVSRHETLDQLSATIAEDRRKMEDAVSSAPPDKRAMFAESARATNEELEALFQPVQHDFRKTDHIESVDGHDCRIWEEHDGNAKRYEFCVAPLGAVPGGADIFRGMQTLSQYSQGAAFALSVHYRSQRWWKGFNTLGGVPILIREFKGGEAVSESRLTAIHVETPNPSLFEPPTGYEMKEPGKP
jgi:hypothetical protein